MMRDGAISIVFQSPEGDSLFFYVKDLSDESPVQTNVYSLA
jgi:hypothetical protein